MAFKVGARAHHMETDEDALDSFNSNPSLRRWNSSPMINNGRQGDDCVAVEKPRRSSRTRTFSASMYHIGDTERVPNVIIVSSRIQRTLIFQRINCSNFIRSLHFSAAGPVCMLVAAQVGPANYHLFCL